ncbi:MAG: hypothetical protein AAGA48_24140 [Myxococcota bacterium]
MFLDEEDDAAAPEVEEEVEVKTKTIIRKRPIVWLVGLTLVSLAAPLGPRLLVDPSGSLAIAPDLAVGMAFIWILSFWKSGHTLQTGIAALVGLAGAVLVMFEGIRAIGRATTGEDLLLYDALMLARTSLGEAEAAYGSMATPALIGITLFATAVFYASGMAIAARWLHEVRWQGPWRSMGLLAVVAAGLFVWFPKSRPVLPPLRDNLVASYQEWTTMTEAIDPEARFGPRDQVLSHPPEIRIAMVRGHTSNRWQEPDGKRMGAMLRSLQRRLASAGWSVATGRTTPAGIGPRGLSEMAILTGLRIPRPPNLAHVLLWDHELDALPRFFDRHGYSSAVLEAANAQPSLRPLGFRNVFTPPKLPATVGDRYEASQRSLTPLRSPSLIWIRAGHQLPEDAVKGLQDEFDSLVSIIANGPEHQVVWLWIGEPAPAERDDPKAMPLVHVIASNPHLLDPWVKESGFRRGMLPGRQRPMAQEALGEALATAIQRQHACGSACAERRRAQLGR